MADLAKDYGKAIKSLSEAEKTFQSLLDAIEEARAAERWNEVPTLRRRCQQAEAALDDALAAAQRAHREYWRQRAALEVPNLRAAAQMMRRYGVMIRASGDGTPGAERAVLDTFTFEAEEIDPSESVPVESPDSELVRDWRDAWRGPRY